MRRSKMGRLPKPASLHILNGNPSKINPKELEKKLEKEMRVPVAIPDIPDYLDPIAKKEWLRITPLLAKLGIISDLDLSTLAAYCSTYSKWVQIERILKKQKIIQKTKVGNKNFYSMQSHDLLRESKDLTAKLRTFCAEFGLSPSARCRIHIPGTETDQDEFEKLLDS